MPTLVFEHDGHQRAGALNGRVLIGRRLSHGVVIADPAVSRLHAWIDNREGTFVLTDAGSRTGTFVNGNAIVRYELQHGDTIQIGPATVKFLAEAAEGGDAAIEMLDLSSPTATVESSKQGILFDCACGAPLWVGAKFAGKRGLCKYCGNPVVVPTPRPAAPAPTDVLSQTLPLPAAPPAPPPPPRRARPARPTVDCGVCHGAIEEGEETTSCPHCGTTFHTDCWMENYGCSTYGCPQVNALKPATVAIAEAASAAAAVEAAVAKEPDEPATTSMPMETILIASSLIASLVGALLFGVLSAVVALVCVGFLFRKGTRRGLLVLALLLAIAGAVGGLALSDFWWLDGRHLPFH